ncbi:DC-STAMP-like protein [Necator americanus]|uniref:DC-STAMP-like protein n=1 Tax=Necator americanus TaxID=51031 RepID=W2SW63_NECAM|nr:DC-STAMP-like protein [Necator americanus]ETN73994.1 DC-STAMP-like protein [Necator americanus]
MHVLRGSKQRMTIWKLYKAKLEAHAALERFLFEAENAKREQLGINKILTWKEKLRRFFSPVYPPWRENFVPTNCYERIFSKGTTMTIWKLYKAKLEAHAALEKFLFEAENAKRENAIARLIRNIIILEAFGLVMYFVLSYKYASRPENVGTILSIVIHTFLVFMFVFPALMSYFMLAVHRMISTKIRGLLLLLMISMSFEGPAMNAVMNIHKVAEGIACVQTDVMSALNDVKGRAVVVNGYFYLMKQAFSVGTKTAEKSLFFHIETAKLKLKKSLTDVIENYILMFETMQTLIKWIFIPMTLFWPFITTALFTFNFNYREEYENNYLTDEFDKIDLDMMLKGRTKALPLNKDEQLLILSNVFYFTGLINVEYPSHYEIKVSGTGEAAEMMRSFQNVFSPLTSDIQERDERWRGCFVEPTPPDYFTIRNIILMFIAAMFLCRFQVWMSRQSLALADHFFPDRVRPRALTLYNRILQDRKNILGAVMNQQKKQLADDQMEGRETVVRRGLQSRGFIRVNCSICNEPDLRLADESNTRICVVCGAFYCIQCFSLRRYCKECQNDMQSIDRVELYYEDVSDDEESDEEEDEEAVEEYQDIQSESKYKVSGVKFP